MASSRNMESTPIVEPESDDLEEELRSDLAQQPMANSCQNHRLVWASVALLSSALGVLLFVPTSSMEHASKALFAQGMAHSSPSPQLAATELSPKAFASRRELTYNELHIATAKEEVTHQFYPAVCTGQSLQAGFTLAALGIKVAAAFRECNDYFYTNGSRRLGEVTNTTHPMMKLHDALTKPLAKLPSIPNIMQGKEHAAKMKSLLEEQGVDMSHGETAYNVTEWDLRLDNASISLARDWTLEGWHFLTGFGGVVLDTRELRGNTSTPGVVAVVAKNGSLVLMAFLPNGSVSTKFSKETVPLRQWVHLAWQRRGDGLSFFANGRLVGTSATNWDLGRHGNTVLLGCAVDEDNVSSKLPGLISNIRLTSAALYNKTTFVAKRRLDILPRTEFLLQNGYFDQVSGRQMHIEGKGQNAGLRSAGDYRELQSATWPVSPALAKAPYGVPPPVGPIQQQPAWCARTILTIIKDAGTIASNIENDLKTCQNAAINGRKCAAAATKAVRAAANAGKYMAEMPVRGCDQQYFEGFYKCGERLEGAAWEFDALGTDLGETVELCQKEPQVTLGQDGKSLNFGACVGEAMSAAAYISVSGLYIGSAVDYDCPGALTPQEQAKLWAEHQAAQLSYNYFIGNKNLNKDYTAYNKAQDLCAQESMGFARTLFLGSAKAVRDGASCSGFNTKCGQHALLSLAAIAGVGQVGAILHDKCQPIGGCCNSDTSSGTWTCNCNTTKQVQDSQALWLKRNGECGRYSGSMAKLIASAASQAAEADLVCNFDKKHEVSAACGSMVSFMIASLGYFAENAARNYYECPFGKGLDLYQCGQDQSKIGEAIERFAGSTAAAVINCGALRNVELPVMRLVGMVHPPRRFFMV